MAKTSNDKKMRGVVLIMVVTVMFVLIIMLLATLSVVSTAQNRYYTKYEENQAYYTARSALDVFTQKILSDDEYYAYDDSGALKTYTYTTVNMSKDASERASSQSTPTAMKQGLALEFEMYKIPAQNDAGFASNFEQSDKIFGESSEISEDELYSIDPSIDKDEGLTYKITFPKISDGTDDYGRFVDEDGGVQQASIKITVESRRYSFGGSNADAFGKMTDEQLKQCSSGTVTYTDDNGNTKTYTANELKEAIRLAGGAKTGRDKDSMRLRIEATAEFMGETGIAVIYFDTAQRPITNSSNAITSLNEITPESGIFAVGGLSSLRGGVTVNDDGVTCGDMFITGDSNLGKSSSAVYMFSSTVDVIKGNVKFDNTYPIFEEEGALIYCTGRFDLINNFQTTFASAFNKANVVAKIFGIGQADYNGNVYCDEFEFTSAPSNGRPTINGKVYTNYINLAGVASLNADGTALSFNNVPDCASDITFAKGFILEVGGVTGRYLYDDTFSQIVSEADPSITYSVTIGSMNFNYDSNKRVDIDYYDPSQYDLEDWYKVFELPEKPVGATEDKIYIPTCRKLYTQVYKENAFADDGELNPVTLPSIDLSQINVDDNNGNPLPDELIQAIIDGNVNNWWEWVRDYGYSWDDLEGNEWSYPPKEGFKSKVNAAVEDYKNNNPAYQAALNAYFTQYISGAEKAETTVTSLLRYTSSTSPLELEPINWNSMDLSMYSDADQANLKTLGAKYVINKSGYLQSYTKYNKIYGKANEPVIIDATANDISIQLGVENGSGPNQEGNYSELQFEGYFIVVGEGTVKFYLPDGTSTGGKRSYALGHYNQGDKCFYVATYDIHKVIMGDEPLILADKAHKTGIETRSPNVWFYAGNNVEQITLGGPDNGFISGYIYAPFASYRYGPNHGRLVSKGVYYNDVCVLAPGAQCGFSIMGSLICRTYSSGNKVGVAYVPVDDNKYNPGDPQFTWNAFLYSAR